MILKDLHVHTSYSDGKDEPRAVVEKALALGMTTLGFSDHIYAPYDTDCCIPLDRMEEYRKEISSLKKEYAGRIEILMGIEYDAYSPLIGRYEWDYGIASVHYLCVDGTYYNLDYKKEMLRELIDTKFCGKPLLMAERYFHTVVETVRRTKAEIVGHFDLITKFNELENFLDIDSKAYQLIWKAAVDDILSLDKIFEINTVAISRGYRTTPYPDNNMVCYIKEKGGRLILSSDSHDKNNLLFAFKEYEELLY